MDGRPPGTPPGPPPGPPGLPPPAPQERSGPASVPIAVEVVPPTAGAPGPTEAEEGSHRGIALLLAATAIAAAIVAAMSSSLSSQAGDAWQSALRQDAKRAAAAVSDIQLIYQAEIPQAVGVLSARLQETRLREAAAAATGQVASALTIEADAQKGVADAIGASVPLVAGDAYLLDGGARNLSQRLADRRNESPDLVAIDPEAAQAEGDALAAQASSMTLALWPLALAAMLGALAEPFRRQRRILLALGTASFGIGVLVVVATGVLG
jgi:hypothetical protein